MKPEDFKFDLLTHAQAIRMSFVARNQGVALDPKTAQWLITYEAMKEYMRSRDILQGYFEEDLKTGRKRLLGIPVRVTINDEYGTPPIQLVIEPEIYPLKVSYYR